MAIRCYIPTSVSLLGAGLESVSAIAPDAASRTLRGEEFEEKEFEAMCIAAGLAASLALAADRGSDPVEQGPDGLSPRAVVAYDAPESAEREPLAEGFEMLRLSAVDMSAVASIHLDESEAWERAVRILWERGPEAAQDHLAEADLLWYDISELPMVLQSRL